MADDADSKSVGGNTVWVQVPPPAPASKTACFLVFRGTGGFSFACSKNGPCFLSAVFCLSFCQMAQTFLPASSRHPSFRLLFSVCRFAKWPKPSSIIFKYKKLFSYKIIFSCGLNWFFSHLFWKLQRQAVIGDPRGFILMLHI